MKIRKATPNDAGGIAYVQVESWKTTYKNIVPDAFLNQLSYEPREERWREMIPKQLVFVAENEKGEIVGFSSGGKERFGKYTDYQGELYAIYILQNYQRKGIGKELVKPIVKGLMEQRLYSMLVFVLAENNARYFYESLGAKPIGTEEIEIGGKKLDELVYGWEDIREIQL